MKSYYDFSYLPRKEVIQPHLPVRLPCYDFTPVTNPALERWTRERIQRSVLICVY